MVIGIFLFIYLYSHIISNGMYDNTNGTCDITRYAVTSHYVLLVVAVALYWQMVLLAYQTYTR